VSNDNGKTTHLGGWLPFLIVIAVFLLVYFITGIRMCAVVSGSMEPNLPTWSLSFVSTRTKYEDLKVGDIVVYNRESDGKRIIHRVIEITEEGIVTKGDHNKIDDGVSVTPDNLYGRHLFYIPKVGKLPMLIHTPAGIAVVGALLALLIISTVADERKARKRAGAAQTPPAERREEKE